MCFELNLWRDFIILLRRRIWRFLLDFEIIDAPEICQQHAINPEVKCGKGQNSRIYSSWHSSTLNQNTILNRMVN